MARVLDFRSSTVGVTVNALTSPRSTVFTDVILGSNLNDLISALNGRDLVYGYGGNDRIFGGAGFDRIFGGDGNDFIQDLDRGGRLHGDNGNDTINGGDGAYMYGGAGSDSITGGDRSVVWADFFNNRSAGAADEVFVGGNSRVNAGAGADLVIAGLGSVVLGDTGNDTLYASEFYGVGAATTRLNGGVGDDIFYANAAVGGTLVLVDSAGNDQISLADFDSTSIDARREGQNLIISLYDPDDEGSILSPAVYATIRVDGQYSGANTIERLGFTEAGAGVTGAFTDLDNVDLNESVSYELRRSLDASLDADNQMLVGTNAGETIRGGAGDDILFGAGGADLIIGDNEIDGSDDTIVGGNGADTMLGGNGEDLFRFSFSNLGTGLDVIEDFDINNDILDLTELLRFNQAINPQAAGFVRAVRDGSGGVIVEVDVDGSLNEDGGVNSSFRQVVQLLGVDPRDLDLVVDFADPTANVLF
jgi:Ca2+-binding RTX toxin-like protein